QRSSREACQKPNNQPQPAKELADADGVSERPHHAGQRSDTRSAERTEKLLCPVGCKDDSHNQADNDERNIHGGTILRCRRPTAHDFTSVNGGSFHPPATAPTTKNGSAPVATAAGSGASGDSC